MEKLNGLIKKNYYSAAANTTYDTVTAKADIITDGANAKAILHVYYNGVELLAEKREVNFTLNRDENQLSQAYNAAKSKEAFNGWLDLIVDSETGAILTEFPQETGVQ